MHRIFSEGGFARVLRAGDSRRFGVDLKSNRDALIKQAVNAAASTAISSSGIYKTKIKNRPCVSIKDYSINLIYRSVAKYLAGRFKIFPRSRNSIVREIIETLSDSTPMYIVRRDLSSFYESLPTSDVKENLEYNLYIPAIIKHHIRAFFSTLCKTDRGVPRGVGMSAIISELVMREADQKIREISGIYKYFRYSDDILIFSWMHPSMLYKMLDEIIAPTGLQFNKSKSVEVHLDCPEKSQRKQVQFEYLGYRFLTHNGHGDDKPRPLDVAVSVKKITRIKTRLICSLKQYQVNKDFALLRDRLRFLSSNYFAYRTGAQAIKTSKFVKSGLYYNYHLCGTYQHGKRLPGKCSELKALDAFYHALLKGQSSSFRKLFQTSQGKLQLSELEKISFLKGFEHKITIRFRPERVQQIKAAWRNA